MLDNDVKHHFSAQCSMWYVRATVILTQARSPTATQLQVQVITGTLLTTANTFFISTKLVKYSNNYCSPSMMSFISYCTMWRQWNPRFPHQNVSRLSIYHTVIAPGGIIPHVDNILKLLQKVSTAFAKGKRLVRVVLSFNLIIMPPNRPFAKLR